MFMDLTSSDVRTNTKRWLRTEEDFLKAEALILRLKASFLEVLLSCRGKWHIENGNLEHLLTRILVGFQNADLDLQRLRVDFFIRNSSAFFILNSLRFSNKTSSGFYIRISLEKSLFMQTNTDGLLSGMRDRLKLLQPDIDQVYTVLSNSSVIDTDMIDEATEAGRIQKNLRLLRSEAGRIQEELEKITSRPDDFRVFSSFSSRFKEFQGHLLCISEMLENQTCFENDIKALFSGGLLLDNHFWLMNVMNDHNLKAFNTFLSEIEKKQKEMMERKKERQKEWPRQKEREKDREKEWQRHRQKEREMVGMRGIMEMLEKERMDQIRFGKTSVICTIVQVSYL